MGTDTVLGIIIGAVFSLIVTTVFLDPLNKFKNYILYFFRNFVFKKKDKEDIIGIYYGYYLVYNNSDDPALKESLWEIYPSSKKNNYLVKIYKVIDTERDKVFNTLMEVKFVNKNEHIPTKEEKRKIKELQISYKGLMFFEGSHFIFKLESQKDMIETVFERRHQFKDTDNQPIVGISLAINPKSHIRANMSILSKKKLTTKDEFYEIIEATEGTIDEPIYNMSFNV